MRLPLLASLLAIVALHVRAETFQVTRTDDPSPGDCVPGDCSLREAMQAAAANDPSGATDVIVLPAGTYTLTRNAAPAAIVQPLRMEGAGAGLTRIAIEPEYTLFNVQAGGDLALSGLGLDASYAVVRAFEGSHVSIKDVIAEEGMLQVFGGASMDIRHSELRRSLYCGGNLLIEDSAIFNLAQLSGTLDATLRRVVVDGSLNPDPPPGTVTRLLVHAGTLAIEDSQVTQSGILVDGDAVVLSMRRVHYAGNIEPVRTESAAAVTIEDSLFENNDVRALYAAGGAEWNVGGSSFVNNKVDGNAGGAIVLEDNTTLRIRNSTFSGNTFSVDAAQGGARGAAIGFRNGTGAHLVVQHVTIVRPPIMAAGIVGTAIGGHGNGVTLDLSNSIVGGTCGMNSSVLQNNSGNIESTGNTCGLDNQQNRINVSAADFTLGPLGAHGGWTPTHLPANGSVAIDGASSPQCLSTDQRGYGRPGGARCDVGAVEADADDVLFADGFE